MSRSRLRSKSFGISALVIGLMAIGACSAHAEAGAKWLVGTQDANDLPAFVQGEVDKTDVSLLTKFLQLKFKVLCLTGTLESLQLQGEGKLSAGFKARFEDCTGYIEEKENKNCEPHSAGRPAGVIETLKLKGELVLHEKSATEKVGTTKVEPETGETFVTLIQSEACPVGEEIPVRGKLFLEDASLTTPKVIHLFVPGPLTELWVFSKTAEHLVTLDGGGKAMLAAPHNGIEWSGVPG